MIEVGTRTRTTRLNGATPQGTQTRSFRQDKGLSKFFSGTVTFAAGSAVASSGAFANFAVGDVILIEGTSGNNGYQAVESVVSGGATITGDKGFVVETASSAFVRTA